MHLRRTRAYFAAFAITALSAGSANAATEYTTQASWISALTGGAYTEALPFANQDLANPTLFVNGYGTFTGDSTAVAITMGYTYLSSTRYLDALQDTTVTITAPSGGTNASLLWLGANQTGVTTVTSEPLTITLTDINGNATTFNLTTGANTPSYFGFTSGTAINTITIAAPTGYDMDLMDFDAGAYPNSVGGSGSGSPTAECATILLIAGGLIVVGAQRKFIRPAA
jgi:hypothetical protein